jgi:glycosyltransferase involved in cell wall biosynthesis
MDSTDTGVKSSLPTVDATPVEYSTMSVSLSDMPKAEKKKPLKFLLVSTHCHQYTGYSKVSWGILKELAKNPWLSVTHFGFQKFPNQQFQTGYRPYPPSVRVIDAASLERPFEQGFGFTVLPDVIRKLNPDVVMIYNDMSIIAKFFAEIEKSGVPKTFKMWVYADQVYNCQSQAFIDMLNLKAERIFAFSPFWKKCLKDQGVNRPLDIILHGFESNIYVPLDKAQARKELQMPEDAFVYLNVNRNQPRKRYDLLIMAFVELIVKYPNRNICLLCICDKGDKGGWWLFDIYKRELQLRGARAEQFLQRLMLTSQDMTFPDEAINKFYNIADVGVNSAEGEGWGLCNFEGMGVGVPQVVPNVGGFKEFCTPENSVLVEPKFRYYLPTVYSPVGGEVNCIDAHDLFLGMEKYLNDDLRKQHGVEARKKVLEYTWERAVVPLAKRLKEAMDERDE